jgi:hypothetical protein
VGDNQAAQALDRRLGATLRKVNRHPIQHVGLCHASTMGTAAKRVQ